MCTAASLATAPALDDSVPVWTVALSAALFVAAFLAGRRLTDVRPAGIVFAAGALAGIVLAMVAGGTGATALLILGGAVVVPWVIGRSVQLQSEMVLLAADRARLEERTRIAGDMHDTLGHDLSLLALRAGVLELDAGLDQRHREAAAELRAGAGRATERLADIVTLLRDGEPAPLRPAADGIDDLVDRAVGAGLPVTLTWDGPRPLPPGVDHTARRVVQEALTNAAKHAPGAPVEIRLVSAGGATTVTVTNPLPVPSRRAPGARNGLVGLRERVRVAGGTLEVGPDGSAFVVSARLPHPVAS
ncbi:sensor histidine kinase [Actinoplanes sp. CA-142083]|uniref:sensor histidine kinase n=1 Tax=Actinoplanes sp. CA-142083 TaxID=3239903 RepID=UPI003D93DB5B